MLRFPGGTGEQFQSIRGGETLSTNRYRSQPSPYPNAFSPAPSVFNPAPPTPGEAFINIPARRLFAASSGRKALGHNRLSSRYARHNSIHVAIKICLGEVQRLNGI
jgi:hypothetical protein